MLRFAFSIHLLSLSVFCCFFFFFFSNNRYLKDSDYYTRRISEKQKEDKPIFKRGTSSSRCLCFGSNNSAKPSPVHSETPITVTWKISWHPPQFLNAIIVLLVLLVLFLFVLYVWHFYSFLINKSLSSFIKRILALDCLVEWMKEKRNPFFEMHYNLKAVQFCLDVNSNLQGDHFYRKF